MEKLVDGYAKRLIDTYKAIRKAEVTTPNPIHREELSRSKDEVLATLIGYLEKRVERLNQVEKVRLCN